MQGVDDDDLCSVGPLGMFGSVRQSPPDLNKLETEANIVFGSG
jgi:hypothetical protein